MKKMNTLALMTAQALLQDIAVPLSKNEEPSSSNFVVIKEGRYYVAPSVFNQNAEVLEVLEDHFEAINAQFGNVRRKCYRIDAETVETLIEAQQNAERQLRRADLAAKAAKKGADKLQKEIIQKDILSENIQQVFSDVKDIYANFQPPMIQVSSTPIIAKNGENVPLLLLSDLHLEATVDARQINGLNEFNLDIAKERFKKLFRNFEKTMFKSATDELCVIACAGDLFEGYIHDECRFNGSVTIGEIMTIFVEWMHEELFKLSKHFKKVYVPAVVGNHGRIDKGYQMQNKALENYEYMALQMLKMRCYYLKNVVVEVSSGTDAIFQVVGHRFLMTHGDQCKSAGGVGGIYPSLLKMYYRKMERAAALNKKFDTMLIGHFHQFHDAHNIVVNGSLKGYDNYAFESNFTFEPPRQAAMHLSRHYGRVNTTPIYCEENPKFLSSGDTSSLFESEIVNMTLSVD